MWHARETISLIFPFMKQMPCTILRLHTVYHEKTIVPSNAMNEALDQYFCRGCEIMYDELLLRTSGEGNLSKDERRCLVEDIVSFLRPSNCAFEVIFPVKQDDGRYELFTGYRIQHKLHLKPCFGGIAVSDAVDREWLGARAALNSYACACARVPFGGAQAGVHADPRKYSRQELERVVRRFALELFSRGIAGPSVDVLGPEMESRHMKMSWIADTYSKTFGSADMSAPASVTGKPPAQGGLPDHGAAQARGLLFAVTKVLADHRDYWVPRGVPHALDGRAVVLQGLGDVGVRLLPLLAEAGARCVGVEEDGHAVYEAAGIDVQALQKSYAASGSLAEVAGSWRTQPSEGLRCEPCDVLVMLDASQPLDVDQAGRLQAKMVVEAAPFAVEAAAGRALAERGVLLLPDVFVLGARAAVAHLEWLKGVGRTAFGRTFLHFGRKCSVNLLDSVQEALERRLGRASGRIVLAPADDVWPARSEADIVDVSLEQTVESAAKDLMETLQRHNLELDVRGAAYANAIRNIFDVYQAGGLEY